MTARKRPWLAALLAVLYPGLGHAYLRRWRRGLGWFGLAFLTAYAGILVADVPLSEVGGVAGALRVQQSLPVEVSLVILLVSALNAVDAYRLATRTGDPDPTPADDDADTCPECGKELDEDLDFCPWCTARL